MEFKQVFVDAKLFVWGSAGCCTRVLAEPLFIFWLDQYLVSICLFSTHETLLLCGMERPDPDFPPDFRDILRRFCFILACDA